VEKVKEDLKENSVEGKIQLKFLCTEGKKNSIDNLI